MSCARLEMPAVLVEAGFIDNEKDNEFFDENFDKIAQAIADGIEDTIQAQENAKPEYYQVQVGATGSGAGRTADPGASGQRSACLSGF